MHPLTTRLNASLSQTTSYKKPSHVMHECHIQPNCLHKEFCQNRMRFQEVRRLPFKHQQSLDSQEINLLDQRSRLASPDRFSFQRRQNRYLYTLENMYHSVSLFIPTRVELRPKKKTDLITSNLAASSRKSFKFLFSVRS